MLKAFLSGLVLIVVSAGCGAYAAANAATVNSTVSYIGDICDDFDSNGGDTGTDFNDCNEIIQNGGPLGLFTLELSGLKSVVLSDVLVTLSVNKADLFLVGGANNPAENFGLALDQFNLGTLFDGSTTDEASVNPSLAASVQQSIDAAVVSDSAINLSFTVAMSDFEPLVANRSVAALIDFSNDLNVNTFRDISFSVTYESVPLPATGFILASALVGAGTALRRRKRL